MTCCGGIAFLNAGLIWADEQQFTIPDRRHGGFANKLTINASGLYAATSAGLPSLSAASAATVANALNIHAAADALAPLLRREALRLVRGGIDADEACGHCTVLVGWSEQYDRIIGFELAGWRMFVPKLTSRSVSPEVATHRLDPMQPFLLPDVLRRQLAVLRETVPEARSTPVAYAVLRPDGVEVRRLEAPPEAVECPIAAELERVLG